MVPSGEVLSFSDSRILLIYKTCRLRWEVAVNCQFAHLVMSGESSYQVFIFHLLDSGCGPDWEDTASHSDFSHRLPHFCHSTTSATTNGFISRAAAENVFIMNAFCFLSTVRLNNYVTFVKQRSAATLQSAEGRVCIFNYSGLKAACWTSWWIW